MPRLCRMRDVNCALAVAGRAERLVKGKGYFYFTAGEAPTWKESGVYVYRIGSLTLEQWLAEFERLSGVKLNGGK